MEEKQELVTSKNEIEPSDKNDEKDLKNKRKNEIIGILLIALGLFSSIAIFTATAGMLGTMLANLYHLIVGLGAYLIPLLFIIWGITLIRLKGLKFNVKLIGFLLTYIVILAIIHTYLHPQFPLEYAFQKKTGGVIGGGLAWLLLQLFGKTGTYIILGAFLLIGFLLWFDILLLSIFSKIKFFLNKLLFGSKNDENSPETEDNLENEDVFEDTSRQEVAAVDQTLETEDIKEEFFYESEVEDVDDDENYNQPSVPDNINSDSNYDNDDVYVLPHMSLLNKSDRRKVKLDNKTELLEETLKSFGVNARVIQVSHGPSITRYEVQPASGVKVSKIVNLADDLALALAAPDVRIEAPIPGKAAVGIEVPHSGNILVHLRDIISTEKFKTAKSKLTLALGKGIDGEPIITDLSKMPHLLVAGATGSGKSVCINTLITSIIYKATPGQVKLILIDPKKVELSNYQGLPHLFSPVVTDPKKASNVLKLVVEEMENRYDLFSESGTRGITSYNKKVNSEEKLPYIVVIIDELSDLMMVAANEVEDNICRLAQMSRAAGIHLVIATQRPSVDVITGLIKANIPSRISFAVSSQTDSRTILDMGGAEKLLGKGDMLFAPVDAQKPQRIQGAFISNEEIFNIVDFIKKQSDPDYEVELEDIKQVEISLDNQKDKLYEEAVKLVVKYRASISMLQRRLHIGHSRAARLIDMMEEEDIVGPYAGSKPREVLITEDELDNYIENESDDEEINNEPE